MLIADISSCVMNVHLCLVTVYSVIFVIYHECQTYFWSLSRNLTKRWQKCDIRQSSIGQMLKSHFCHFFILVFSFRPALDCMICNVVATEAYWWTFHVRFKRFGLRTFPMIIWSTSGRSLYFRKPQTFVVTKNSFVSPHLMKICDSLRSSCVVKVLFLSQLLTTSTWT